MPTGLPALDRPVRTSYEWLDQVAARLGGERRHAYHALHAVLGALRERLPPDLAGELSARMPLLVRGIFFDGGKTGRKARTNRTTDDFVGAVRRALPAAAGADALPAIAAVLDALAVHVDGATFARVRELLPPDLSGKRAPGAVDAPLEDPAVHAEP